MFSESGDVLSKRQQVTSPPPTMLIKEHMSNKSAHIFSAKEHVSNKSAHIFSAKEVTSLQLESLKKDNGVVGQREQRQHSAKCE